MAKKGSNKQEQEPKVSIFGSKSGSLDSSLSSLFTRPTQINNKALIAQKQRTIVEIPKGETSSEDEDEKMEDEEQEQKETPKLDKKSKKQQEENYDLEAKYMTKILQEEAKEEAERVKNPAMEDVESSSDSDDEDDESKPKETTESTTTTNTKAAKTVDLKTVELEKAERTVFVGNVPSSIISTKKATKQFKNIFKEFGPIDSVRFRSLNITSNMPRKAAFISKSFKDGETVNAYIVFKNKPDSLKAVKLNGSIFADHHLRVDHLTHPLKQDNKLSIFVGNLDFEEHEESLWVYFNEKCKVNSDDTNIVSNVRIIRDSKTSFGKGFAIVQFIDSNHVDKALLLNGKKLSVSNAKKQRDLRISRCKNTVQLQRSNGVSKGNYTDKQKTIIGRGKKLLNKSDRNSIGRLVVEGERSKRGEKVRGIKNGIGAKGGVGKKKPRHANSRASKRSQEFKKRQMEAAAAK
ncbi:hypothetical protein CANARDRAFT_27492 [[Candida] arabinofermentans NRRL YB-2248]|uniref:Nucleolar protein 12 n=1 Tax=[Candida] arabinofermentans NRRL YB-2248 TaxID=983967 RepID=A0A1E4T394_9ASCO|nr:hypothetical protein CANARDRAFT_27492 [[Candida] arabinofermentans NRRL YB-2248]